MRSRWRIAAGAGGLALLVVFAGGLLELLPSLAGSCDNEVVAVHEAPGGVLKLVVFVRNCGATTGVTTQASILPGDAILPEQPGNLFVADTNQGDAPAATWGGPALDAHWEGPQSVVLAHHPWVRIFKAERRVLEVDVRYATAGKDR